MQKPPRKMTETFLNWKELSISIVQGLVITLGILFVYQWTFQNGGTEEKTRAMVFSTLIFANVFLSFVNRSFYYSVFQSFRNRNPLLVGISMAVLVLLMLILYVKPISNFFQLTSLSFNDLLLAFGVAMISVLWFEIYKYFLRLKSKR